jgi:hypothetical protein
VVVLGVVVGGLVGGTVVVGAGDDALSSLGTGAGGGSGAAANPLSAWGTGGGGVGVAAGRSTVAAAEAGGAAGGAAVVAGALVLVGDFEALSALRMKTVTPANPTTNAATHASTSTRRLRLVSRTSCSGTSTAMGGVGSSGRASSRSVAEGAVTLVSVPQTLSP